MRAQKKAAEAKYLDEDLLSTIHLGMERLREARERGSRDAPSFEG